MNTPLKPPNDSAGPSDSIGSAESAHADGTNQRVGALEKRFDSVSRPRLRWLLIPLGVLGACTVVANAIYPKLLDSNPTLLIVLEARNRNLLLVSNMLGPITFYGVGIGRRLLGDPFFYLLGRWYGTAAIDWAERKSFDDGRIVRLVERLYSRMAPVLVFFSPGALVCTLAGASGLPAGVFVFFNVTGTVFMVWAMRTLGSAFEAQIEAVQRFNRKYVVPLTIITVLVVVLLAIRRRRAVSRKANETPTASVSDLGE